MPTRYRASWLPIIALVSSLTRTNSFMVPWKSIQVASSSTQTFRHALDAKLSYLKGHDKRRKQLMMSTIVRQEVVPKVSHRSIPKASFVKEPPRAFIYKLSRLSIFQRKAAIPIRTHFSKRSPKSNIEIQRWKGKDSSVLRSSWIKSVVKNSSENILRSLIQRLSATAKDVDIAVFPRGNTLKEILSGRFHGDLRISFSNIAFKPLRLTAGSIKVKRLFLNLWSFSALKSRRGAIRYPSQFDIHFQNFILTEDDLMASKSIRNGLELLLRRTLSRTGIHPSFVNLKTIRVLPNGKISCSGETQIALGNKIEFEVRSGIDLSSRGHILTFLAVEVSLQPSSGIFISVLPSITLDMGHNARITSINIDGVQKSLNISAQATVTPDHTLKLQKYPQIKESLAANFAWDAGRWLTRIGNFTT